MGRRFVARIGANESVFGPSPRAVAAMADGRRRGLDVRRPRAPRPQGRPRRPPRRRGPQNITVGEGIDGLLGNLVRLLVAPGTPVVTSAGAYPTFDYHVTGFGGTARHRPLPRRRRGPRGAAPRRPQGRRTARLPRQPRQPDGQLAHRRPHRRDDRPAARRLPSSASTRPTPTSRPPTPSRRSTPREPRVIRMRTFSKAHGMAGARVGYALGHPDLVAAFDRVRNHFGVNAHRPGRRARRPRRPRLARPAWSPTSTTAAPRIAEIAAANGLRALPSATNFVAIDCGRDGAFARARPRRRWSPAASSSACRSSPPQDRCIRVTVGRPADLDAFAAALPPALEAAAYQ